ncbi:hypothetical protein [Janibacter corallicola]|uniref:hypothetical protein n=1 Tax=Janibacter corallicola TaxID=415212 RepID=UPI0008303A08|nr:hypothetical protein [Janibacter corallicola]
MDHPTAPTRSTIARRGVLGTGLAASLAAAGSLVAGPAAAASSRTTSDPADRDVVLIGANPGFQLFDGDRVTAYVSAWRVDWSPHGSGTAVICWYREQVHVYSGDHALASWLERDFTRHFPEVEGLPWPAPILHRAPAHIDIDMASGARVRAGELSLAMGDVRDQRSFTTDDFPLGGVDHSLHLVLGPCFRGRGRIGGSMMEGGIVTSGTPERPSSSAFITEAEVWRR